MSLTDEVAEALKKCNPSRMCPTDCPHCKRVSAAILRYGALCRKAGRQEATLPESIQQALNSGDGTYKP